MRSVAPSLYRQLASHYHAAIAQGTLPVGSRFPSLRELMRRHAVSMSTALMVCRTLEDEGWLQARARSGYFVRQPQRSQLQPLAEHAGAPAANPGAYVGMNQHISALLAKMDAHPAIFKGFYSAVCAPEIYPAAALQHSMRQVLRKDPEILVRMARRYGHPAFKATLARRALERGMTLAADEVTVTHGCTEALNLALRATTDPGDTVVVESPVFYGLLQTLESLGRKVLEIPSSPATGLSLEALQFALAQPGQRVRAVICMPVFQNPLGCSMPDAHKAALVELCRVHAIALIEDDIYAYMGPPEPGALPRPLKAWDRHGGVIHCTSLNKMLAPGMRLGWLAGGRWQERIEMLKYAQSRFPEEAGQLAVAQFMEGSGFDRHVLRMQQKLAVQRQHLADAIARHFPPQTRLSMPQGGMLLWVQLPEQVQADTVFEQGLQQGVRVAPGSMFSNSHRFDHCLRLSCGACWSDAQEQGVRTLGQIVQRLADVQGTS